MATEHETVSPETTSTQVAEQSDSRSLLPYLWMIVGCFLYLVASIYTFAGEGGVGAAWVAPVVWLACLLVASLIIRGDRKKNNFRKPQEQPALWQPLVLTLLTVLVWLVGSTLLYGIRLPSSPLLLGVGAVLFVLLGTFSAMTIRAKQSNFLYWLSGVTGLPVYMALITIVGNYQRYCNEWNATYPGVMCPM